MADDIGISAGDVNENPGDLQGGSNLFRLDRGQWAVGSRQWAVGSRQWAVSSGQWAVGIRADLALEWRHPRKAFMDGFAKSRRYTDSVHCRAFKTILPFVLPFRRFLS